MIYQLRTYEIFEGNKDAFHARFRNHAMRIMGRYGFDFAGLWESATSERTEFLYLLRWPDEATMRQQWEAFMADEEWAQIKRETNAAHGDQVGKIEEQVLLLADYSPAV
jgi:heme-degrading monooxygenase HmoA